MFMSCSSCCKMFSLSMRPEIVVKKGFFLFSLFLSFSIFSTFFESFFSKSTFLLCFSSFPFFSLSLIEGGVNWVSLNGFQQQRLLLFLMTILVAQIQWFYSFSYYYYSYLRYLIYFFFFFLFFFFFFFSF